MSIEKPSWIQSDYEKLEEFASSFTGLNNNRFRFLVVALLLYIAKLLAWRVSSE
jgi:hypothetical protein